MDDDMDNMDVMDDTDEVDDEEVLRLAMFKALNDEKNYLVPAESRNALDLHHARIAYNVILRFKSNLREPDLDLDHFLFTALDVCQSFMSSHSYANDHCRILAIACDMISRPEGNVHEDRCDDQWGSFIYLPISCTEIWQLIPEEGNEDVPLFLTGWEKVNSFISHLVGRGYHDGLCQGYEEIGRALEQPIIKGSVMDCRVRVAAEWIINCGDLMLMEMTVSEDSDDSDDSDDNDDNDSGYEDNDDEDSGYEDNDDEDSDDEYMRPGPIYGEGLPFLSLHRWEFWKTRLAEFEVSPDLEDETKKRVTTALKLMRAPSEWEKRTSSLERAVKEQLEIVATGTIQGN